MAYLISVPNLKEIHPGEGCYTRHALACGRCTPDFLQLLLSVNVCMRVCMCVCVCLCVCPQGYE